MEEAREEAQRAHKAKHTLSFHFDLTSSDQHSSLDRHLPPSLLPTSSSKRFFDANDPLTPAGGVSISRVPGEEVGGQRARLGYPATLTRALGGAAASALLTPTLLPLLLHFLDRGSSLVILSAPKRYEYIKGAFQFEANCIVSSLIALPLPTFSLFSHFSTFLSLCPSPTPQD